MSKSNCSRAHAIKQILAALERHLEAGLRGGHYGFDVKIRPSGKGGREVIIGGGATDRYDVPAPETPLFRD